MSLRKKMIWDIRYLEEGNTGRYGWSQLTTMCMALVRNTTQRNPALLRADTEGLLIYGPQAVSPRLPVYHHTPRTDN